MLIGEIFSMRSKTGKDTSSSTQFLITIVMRKKAVDCRIFRIGRNEESIFGIDGYMCLAWWERGPWSKRVRKEQAPDVPSCMTPLDFHWRLERCDMHFCGERGYTLNPAGERWKAFSRIPTAHVQRC